ncbi:MAG TPA: xanthine dehydrogenase family protein subunit M [Hyphomicrobiaceae bacterium]|nr:xanthine dehydrogenase family protein subunit M [Hyphomicrobiaceae bacterium]
MDTFTYFAPQNITGACAALASGNARPLAGGTDLLPQMREGRRTAAHVVDLKRIPECSTINLDPDGTLKIGSAVSATAIANHPDISARFPVLRLAARLIGSLQVQNRATFGGNICNAAPSADAAPPLIALDARAIISGPGGQRTILVEDMFQGPGRNSLATGEILTHIIVPAMTDTCAAHYLRFTPRREMDIAIAGVATRVTYDAQGKVTFARIAMASVAPTPIRAIDAEAMLIGQTLTDGLIGEVAEAARAAAQPISDTRGSADFRRELTAVLTRRTLQHCRNLLMAEVAK